MNSNDNNEELINNYPWYLDSIQLPPPPLQEKHQEKHQEKYKKKSRGNRRLQRYRRKLRKQRMNSDIIAELVHLSVDTSQSTTNTMNQEEIEGTTNSTFNENVSDVPKMIEKKKKKYIKKKKTIIKKNKTNANDLIPKRKVKIPPLIKDSYDYSTVSDQIFSKMISTGLDGIENYLDFMDQNEKIKFIRRYTSLIDRLSYVKLQEFQWKYYHQIGTKEKIWKGRIAKYTAQKYSIHYTYGRSKTIIEHRLKQIEQHLAKAENAIQQFKEEISSKFTQENKCYVVMEKLSLIISQFVQEKQKLLQYQLEYKREILCLDAMDHQLLQKFYHVEPNKAHHIIARRIWVATKQQMLIKEDITLLEHRLLSTQAQSTSNLVHRIVNNLDKLLNKSKIINREMENDLNQIIQVEQNKFSVKNRYMESTSQWQKMVYDTIEQRRLHMIERANFILKHKLAILFNRNSNNGNYELVISHDLDEDEV